MTARRGGSGWPYRWPGPALVAVVLAGALALAACGSGGGSAGPAGSRTTTSGGGPATGGVTTLDEAAGGTAVTVARGERIAVTLHSTYWQLAPPADTRILAVTAAPVARPDPTCRSIPGTGCGTVTATYSAAAPGTTTISAHRDTCGEALRCTPDRSDWSVTVHVTG